MGRPVRHGVGVRDGGGSLLCVRFRSASQLVLQSPAGEGRRRKRGALLNSSNSCNSLNSLSALLAIREAPRPRIRVRSSESGAIV
jgi:hypothetical protein